MDYFEGIRFEQLERSFLDPPDVDEVLPFDDWRFTLEDICYDESKEDSICN